MKTENDAIATTISLTDEQRKNLASDFNIPVDYVPSSLGVVGMAKTSASILSLPESVGTRFSPSMLIT